MKTTLGLLTILVLGTIYTVGCGGGPAPTPVEDSAKNPGSALPASPLPGEDNPSGTTPPPTTP